MHVAHRRRTPLFQQRGRGGEEEGRQPGRSGEGTLSSNIRSAQAPEKEGGRSEDEQAPSIPTTPTPTYACSKLAMSRNAWGSGWERAPGTSEYSGLRSPGAPRSMGDPASANNECDCVLTLFRGTGHTPGWHHDTGCRGKQAVPAWLGSPGSPLDGGWPWPLPACTYFTQVQSTFEWHGSMILGPPMGSHLTESAMGSSQRHGGPEVHPGPHDVTDVRRPAASHAHSAQQGINLLWDNAGRLGRYCILPEGRYGALQLGLELVLPARGLGPGVPLSGQGQGGASFARGCDGNLKYQHARATQPELSSGVRQLCRYHIRVCFFASLWTPRTSRNGRRDLRTGVTVPLPVSERGTWLM